jgi:hypothetical protein
MISATESFFLIEEAGGSAGACLGLFLKTGAC